MSTSPEVPLAGHRLISGASALVGVLGDPVGHSLSPAMHNAALAAMDIDWVYLALPVSADALALVLPALEAMDCRGLNVTLPHKRAVAALAAELTPLARQVGAVNTLVRRPEGGWLGTNTDVEGFLAPLRPDPWGRGIGAVEPSPDWSAREALVLGCGGSARAVVAALVELGVGHIRIAGRRSDHLAAFVTSCSRWAPQLQQQPWETGPGSGLKAAVAAADLLVNTTPVGMASARDPEAASRCPLRAELLDALSSGSTVYDLIYTPRPTALLQDAARRGCRTIDGLDMLVHQGAAALRLWSGRQDVPVAVMRRAAKMQLVVA